MVQPVRAPTSTPAAVGQLRAAASRDRITPRVRTRSAPSSDSLGSAPVANPPGLTQQPDRAAAPVLRTGQNQLGHPVQRPPCHVHDGHTSVYSSSASCSTHSRAGPSAANSSVIAASSWSRRSTRMPVAPHSRAYAAKSGLTSEVCQTGKSSARCSLLILPSACVVEQHVLDRDAVLDRGGQLGGVLAEAAVAGDRDDRPGRRRAGPRPERGRVAEADRAEVAGHQHRLARRLEVAAERVGVVADVDGDDRVGGQVPRQRVEHGGGRHARGRGRRPTRRAFSARQIAHRAATSARWSTALRLAERVPQRRRASVPRRRARRR